MTMTDEPIAQAVLDKHLDIDTQTPDGGSEAGGGAVTRAQVIAAIQCEAGISHDDADDVISFFQEAMTWCLKVDYDVFHLDADHIMTVHATIDVIMPDDTEAVPGSRSAHDLLNRYVSDPRLGEVGLLHGKAGGVIRDCTVTVVRLTED